MSHKRFMEIAINISRKNIGMTHPNPSVGCVVVNRYNDIIGIGCTGYGGVPHAEAIALQHANDSELMGAIMYVTLEPCTHYGKTPPCVDAIIKSGIARVVIAVKDINPSVNGNGIKKLQDASIEVICGICEEEARRVNCGFFTVQQYGRPFITLKLAVTMDFKIADCCGNSQWISNEIARKMGHKMRAINDAIMIGHGTLIKDDPYLNCRLPGLSDRSPVKIVITKKNQKICNDMNILKDKKQLVVITNCDLHSEKGDIDYLTVSYNNGRADLHEVMQKICKIGITTVLVEGGAQLATSLLANNLVDQIVLFRSNQIAGNDAMSAIGSLRLNLEHFYKFDPIDTISCGETDIMEVFVKPLPSNNVNVDKANL